MITIAIIGAGPAGLVAAKTAKEHGLTPTVFEKEADIGGLWKPDAWPDMRTNLSRHTCCFSDYPWQEEAELFPTKREMHGYLQSYCDHFKLRPSIKLNATVLSVRQEGNEWSVTWKRERFTTTESYTHLIVASGFFSKPHLPTVPGTFTGQQLHTSSFSHPEDFRGKKVMVVGGAFSGCEIAGAVAETAAKVTHVFRRACYVLPRTLPPSGMPIDFLFYQRKEKASEPLPDAERLRLRHLSLSKLTSQATLSPALAVDAALPPYVAISDSYLDSVKAGKIDLKKSSVTSMQGSCITLEDQTEHEVDVVIWCTGWKSHLTFLDPAILSTLDYDPDDSLQPVLLHQCILHPLLPNFACIGLYRGPYFGVMDLQASLVCGLFTGKIAGPSTQQMVQGIKHEKALREENPRPQFAHSDYVAEADELAKMIGALPNLENMKRDDPALYDIVRKTPVLPAYYRLEGPGSNPTAARTLLMQAHRLVESYSPPTQ